MLKTYIITLLSVGLLVACANKHSALGLPIETIENEGVTIDVYDYNSLKPLLEQNDDVLHVINFWATWCKPCVKELPYFEMIEKLYSNKKVKVTLISLDLPSQVADKLIPFIKKRKLESEVVLLDDTDANYWISDIDKKWSGAIPATLFYKGGKRQFFEKSFTYNELEQEVKRMLN